MDTTSQKMNGGDIIQNVKQSYYKAPNIFSEIHRKLPRALYMSDIDHLQFNLNSENILIDGEDRLYSEYTIGNQRQAKTIALYDYKHKISDRLKEEMKNLKIGGALWYQKGIAEQLGANFYIVCATNGKMPLKFYKATKTSFELVGILADASPEALQSFWRDNLKLTS